MSEKQRKLKFEEDKERTATRSPPRKSKVEQSVSQKQKLKQDADKAAENPSTCVLEKPKSPRTKHPA